ncbi:MAG: NotI family restriction endonuclease [Hyphomicrobiaceae bacterium]
MALRIVEFFGYAPLDSAGFQFATDKKCPFTKFDCTKPNHGSCTLEQLDGRAVICCPNRLYAERYQILTDVAQIAFGGTPILQRASDLRRKLQDGTLTGEEVAVFGRNWNQELAIPRPKSSGKGTSSFYVDWVLASIDKNGKLKAFTAVEVQTIDTTGNYSEQATAYFARQPFKDQKGRQPGFSNSGFNWENVSKRILPQLIYKGHVLRGEEKCSKGLFFICPTAVLERIKERLGNKLKSYPVGNGTITFRSYDVGPDTGSGRKRKLAFVESFTTTVDQVAVAFTSPTNLPENGVYESAIEAALSH